MFQYHSIQNAVVGGVVHGEAGMVGRVILPTAHIVVCVQSPELSFVLVNCISRTVKNRHAIR